VIGKSENMLPFALDLGYLIHFDNGAKAGITLKEMGPRVKVKDEVIPLHFSIDLAGAYAPDYRNTSLWWLSPKAELRLHRKFVNNPDGKDPSPFLAALVKDPGNKSVKSFLSDIQYTMGIELTFKNFISARTGIVLENLSNGYRHDELRFGIGVNVFNHFRFDWYGTHSFNNENNVIYSDQQWGATFTFVNLFDWHSQDFQWKTEGKPNQKVIDQSDGEFVE